MKKRKEELYIAMNMKELTDTINFIKHELKNGKSEKQMLEDSLSDLHYRQIYGTFHIIDQLGDKSAKLEIPSFADSVYIYRFKTDKYHTDTVFSKTLYI
jgi:hypothetical protein